MGRVIRSVLGRGAAHCGLGNRRFSGCALVRESKSLAKPVARISAYCLSANWLSSGIFFYSSSCFVLPYLQCILDTINTGSHICTSNSQANQISCCHFVAMGVSRHGILRYFCTILHIQTERLRIHFNIQCPSKRNSPFRIALRNRCYDVSILYIPIGYRIFKVVAPSHHMSQIFFCKTFFIKV